MALFLHTLHSHSLSYFEFRVSYMLKLDSHTEQTSELKKKVKSKGPCDGLCAECFVIFEEHTYRVRKNRLQKDEYATAYSRETVQN